MSLGVMNIENLNEKFINPAIRYMFPEYANSFKYGSNTSINQSEICFDIPTSSRKEVREIIFNLSARESEDFPFSSLECEKGGINIPTFLKRKRD